MKNIEKNISSKKGFTLMELMLVVAIIGILAGIVTVSLVGQRERGTETKVLAELSGTIQPIMTCLSDDGSINPPSGGTDICDLGPAYGTWPQVPSGYITIAAPSDFSDGTWYFEGDPGTSSGNTICCNKLHSQCAIISGNCDNTTDLTQ